MGARDIDLTRPDTWEFSGFSQNGEDGILDILRKRLNSRNRYFIEIGAADGIENNSAWLVVAEKYNGIMIEGNSELVERARRSVIGLSIGAECHQMFVTIDTVQNIKKLSLYANPDIISLDIDGNDYYIAEEIFKVGFRPKIFVVEYNSVYGPDQSITIEYKPDFVFTSAHDTHLYYGVSISGWRNFFEKHNYHFVTVDQNGVNAFFVDPCCFDAEFLDRIQGVTFVENQSQYKKFRVPWKQQFTLIEDQIFVAI